MKIRLALLATLIALAGCGSDGATRHVVVSPSEAAALDSGDWTVRRQPGSPEQGSGSDDRESAPR